MSRPLLDHIVILLSPEDFDNVPAWLSDNFTILDGGTHAKGTSHNKLILFEDGTYLELFAWVQPPPKDVPAHADFPSWASRPTGEVIDWALTGGDPYEKFTATEHALKESPELNLVYDEPREGGRKRLDGKELKWATTRPRLVDESKPGDSRAVPFFCHDITDRPLRVPFTKEASEDWPAKVTHACGAIGVKTLMVHVPRDQLEHYTMLYNSLLGYEGQTTVDEVTYQIPRPGRVGKALESAADCVLYLKSNTDSSGIGITSIGLETSYAGERPRKLSSADFGTTINI